MVDSRLARDLRLTWAHGWLMEHYNSSATSFRKSMIAMHDRNACQEVSLHLTHGKNMAVDTRHIL